MNFEGWKLLCEYFRVAFPFLICHPQFKNLTYTRDWTTRPPVLTSTTEWNLEQNIWCFRKPQSVGKIETNVVSSAGPLFKSLKSHTVSQSIEIHIESFTEIYLSLVVSPRVTENDVVQHSSIESHIVFCGRMVSGLVRSVWIHCGIAALYTEIRTSNLVRYSVV